LASPNVLHPTTLSIVYVREEQLMRRSFDDKVVLVTGAAGSGIGQATAMRFARDGASVIVTDIHQERTERAVARIAESTGARVTGRVLDVGDLEGIGRIVAEAEASMGPIDILINNAAINPVQPFENMSMKDWEETLRANLTGPMELIRILLPGMKEKGWGAIVNVSSVATYTSPAGEAPYAATKAALHSLTRTVAAEVGPYGIRCNTVAPGLVWTKFLEKNEEQFRPEIEKTPLRRFGYPDDVADVIAFLASEESRFITGETIVVSGGWYMGH
jgi:3-oxoacyl-[acyl-carrier protein] reductase